MSTRTLDYQVQSKGRDGFFTSSFHETLAEAQSQAKADVYNGKEVSYCGLRPEKILTPNRTQARYNSLNLGIDTRRTRG